ncbi:hypothetical protein AWZ03_001633 [Drosophila navojoa]|uniref:Uncharacterized protein n=1 Tax=Drosophila navojoa TaxID=7232 RepID=A0A484BTC1_DRONA|nr:hypothetical protein AWZ03_001633 [Drosophila navojoa]
MDTQEVVPPIPVSGPLPIPHGTERAKTAHVAMAEATSSPSPSPSSSLSLSCLASNGKLSCSGIALIIFGSCGTNTFAYGSVRYGPGTARHGTVQHGPVHGWDNTQTGQVCLQTGWLLAGGCWLVGYLAAS